MKDSVYDYLDFVSGKKAHPEAEDKYKDVI